ncbi:MAG TPA: histidinol-phosphate transaminase [Gammaproteobacteria bacterium]|nr:histidinol-phosphate transaminase [Gammaproteobacteria bacterium]
MLKSAKLFHVRSKSFNKKLTRPDWTKITSRDPSLLWLDKNENNDQEYIELIKNVILNCYHECINHYPDCALLYNKIASNLKINSNQLLLGAGSDGIIRHAFDTFVSRGDTVVYTHPSFAMYAVYCDIFEARSCQIDYKKSSFGIHLDMDAFLRSIHDNRPTLICLPNPDSPTGTLVSQDNIISIIEAGAKVNAAVLIDEAYYPFSEYTVLPIVRYYPNLILARTFSKAWGLAGARVGYAVANHDLISLMHKVRPMYELGSVSVALAIKILDYQEAMLASVKRLNEGKDYFKIEMEQLGFKTLESAGNFQHVAFGEKANFLHTFLKDIVLYRLDFSETVLEGYSRFSTMPRKNFQKLVTQIKSAIYK